MVIIKIMIINLRRRGASAIFMMADASNDVDVVLASRYY